VIKWFNLWFFYAVGYLIAIIVQEWANKKRGAPFDDPEFLFQGKKQIFILGMTWLLSGFVISLFVEVNYGVLFYIGLVFYLIGMIVGIITLYEFANNSGLVTQGIHQFSRNPIYVGWLIFYFGLTLMGFSFSIASILFMVYFIITFPYFHWTILLEEEFLSRKYGENYIEYLKNSPRYLKLRK